MYSYIVESTTWIYIHVENNREQYCYGYDVSVQDNELGNYIFKQISH